MKDHREHTKRASCPREARRREPAGGIKAPGPPAQTGGGGGGHPAPMGPSRCTISGPGHIGKTTGHWGPGNFHEKGRETQQKGSPLRVLSRCPGWLLVRPSHSLVHQNASDRTHAGSVEGRDRRWVDSPIEKPAASHVTEGRQDTAGRPDRRGAPGQQGT